MLCQLLLYNKVNQLYVYIYLHIPSLLSLPPILPIPPLQVVKDFLKKNFLFYIGVQVINNVVLVSGVQQSVLVSGVQQSNSVTHIHVSILFQILFPFRLLHNIEQSSLCYTVGPCWLSFLFLLEYSCFSMLCQFLLYSKMNQLYIYIYPLCFWISFLFRSPQCIKQSSLCYSVCSHQLPVLYIVSIVYMCQSQPSNSSHPLLSPLVSIHLLSTSVSLFLLCK